MAESYSAVPAQKTAMAVAVADFDGDGRADVAVLSHGETSGLPSGAICVLRGTPDGALSAPRCQDLLDLGDATLLVAGRGSAQEPWGLVAAGSKLSLLAGLGDGSFQVAASAFLSGGANALLTDQDSSPITLFVANGQDAKVSGFQLGAEAQLVAPLQYNFVSNQRTLLYQDLDGDGRKELASLSTDTATVLSAKGAASITQCQKSAEGPYFGGPSGLAAFDADGDGWLDLVAPDIGSTESRALWILRNRGGQSPAFDCARSRDFWTLYAPRGIWSADFDGDGQLDLLGLAGYAGISTTDGIGEVVLLRGMAGHLYDAANESADASASEANIAHYSLQAAPQAGVIADLDGDQKPDVVVVLQSGNLVILRNRFLFAKPP